MPNLHTDESNVTPKHATDFHAARDREIATRKGLLLALDVYLDEQTAGGLRMLREHRDAHKSAREELAQIRGAIDKASAT